MIKSVWKCINIIAISHKRSMEQAEIIDTFWTYHQATSKPLDIVYTLGAFHSEDGADFLWVGVDSSFGNEKTEQLTTRNSECTL